MLQILIEIVFKKKTKQNNLFSGKWKGNRRKEKRGWKEQRKTGRIERDEN